MSSRIEDLSVFGEYKQPENRVTAALLQILKIGGENLLREVSRVSGFQLPDSEVRITSQPSAMKSVPDGLLESEFAFKLYVESKLKQTIDAEQLANHMGLLLDPRIFLLYLTPHDHRPELPERVYWTNWRGIADCLDQYIQNPQVGNLQLLVFLVEHFKTLLTNTGLLGEVWNPENEQVLIVAGSWAEDIALKHNLYICQNRRRFRPSGYMAFYNNAKVQHVFKVVAQPQDDCDVRTIPDFQAFVHELHPDDGPRRLVRLLPAHELSPPVQNNAVDYSGKPCPFTYGQPRYTTLEKLRKASNTSEL